MARRRPPTMALLGNLAIVYVTLGVFVLLDQKSLGSPHIEDETVGEGRIPGDLSISRLPPTCTLGLKSSIDHALQISDGVLSDLVAAAADDSRSKSKLHHGSHYLKLVGEIQKHANGQMNSWAAYNIRFMNATNIQNGFGREHLASLFLNGLGEIAAMAYDALSWEVS